MFSKFEILKKIKIDTFSMCHVIHMDFVDLSRNLVDDAIAFDGQSPKFGQLPL